MDLRPCARRSNRHGNCIQCGLAIVGPPSRRFRAEEIGAQLSAEVREASAGDAFSSSAGSAEVRVEVAGNNGWYGLAVVTAGDPMALCQVVEDSVLVAIWQVKIDEPEGAAITGPQDDHEGTPLAMPGDEVLDDRVALRNQSGKAPLLATTGTRPC